MDDRIILAKEIIRITGVSRVTLWRWESQGNFPKRLQLGPNRIGWRKSEIQSWLESRPVADITQGDPK